MPFFLGMRVVIRISFSEADILERRAKDSCKSGGQSLEIRQGQGVEASLL